MSRNPQNELQAHDLHVRWWRPAARVRLARLPAGGHVLVDLADLSCHELSDPAADLFRAGELPEAAGQEEREFVLRCLAAGWILAADSRIQHLQGDTEA